MKHHPPIIVRVIVIVALLSAAAYWFFFVRDTEADGRLTASGAIEVQEVSISPEQGGRVVDVLVAEADNVTAGQPLIQFDTTLLEGQLAQAKANLAAAQANYEMLAAGPTEAQLSAVQAAVNRAEASLASLNEQLAAAEEKQTAASNQVATLMSQIAEATAALAQTRGSQGTTPGAAETTALAQAEAALTGLNTQLGLTRQLQEATTTQAQLLTSQVQVAEAALDASQAQVDLLLAGARPEQLAVARAQIEALQAAVTLLETQIDRQTLTAPVDGVVLTRSIEPGEVAAPGATLLILGRLDDLTITVYVPEDRYGAIGLGQAAAITADSFPGETFTGIVRHIATKAEFTPRNVQTAAGRASTVFAIELSINDSSGKLKPGMPADVNFIRD